MLITISSFVPRYRIERLLDPTTSYLCLSNNPNSHVLPHPSKPLFGHVPCLLNHFLVCMLGCYPLFPCYSLDWDITLLYYCGLCVYYNVFYTRRRMEGLGYPARTLCSIRVT